MCLRVLKESNKLGSTGTVVRNSVLMISHITFRDCRVHIFPTTFLEIAVYRRAPRRENLTKRPKNDFFLSQ